MYMYFQTTKVVPFIWQSVILTFSPKTSRPHSPKSDTEVERQKSLEHDCLIHEAEDDTFWEWGDIPRKSVSEDDCKRAEGLQSPSGNVEIL